MECRDLSWFDFAKPLQYCMGTNTSISAKVSFKPQMTSNAVQ